MYSSGTSEGYNLYYESALHAALKVDSEKGPRLSGNIEDIENWPMNFQMKLQHFLSGQIKTPKSSPEKIEPAQLRCNQIDGKII